MDNLNSEIKVIEEQHPINLSYTNVSRRILALLIDFLIVLLVLFLILNFQMEWVGFLLQFYKNTHYFSFQLLTNPYTYGLIIVMFFVPLINIYGGSPGQLICGVKIVSNNGNKISFSIALLRTFSKFFFLICSCFIVTYSSFKFDKLVQGNKPPKYIVYIAVLCVILFILSCSIAIFNKHKQALHDLICGSFVIKGK